MPATKCATCPVVTNGKKKRFIVENEGNAFKFVQIEYQLIMAIQLQVGGQDWIGV